MSRAPKLHLINYLSAKKRRGEGVGEKSDVKNWAINGVKAFFHLDRIDRVICDKKKVETILSSTLERQPQLLSH